MRLDHVQFSILVLDFPPILSAYKSHLLNNAVGPLIFFLRSFGIFPGQGLNELPLEFSVELKDLTQIDENPTLKKESITY